mmetsp:Transcript_109559/g.189856  ORF Transcript_109559/g.189856 Transcript_109559/m.189856 type:complete len:230 (-) Transcript_109559:474-1163(-)
MCHAGQRVARFWGLLPRVLWATPCPVVSPSGSGGRADHSGSHGKSLSVALQDIHQFDIKHLKLLCTEKRRGAHWRPKLRRDNDPPLSTHVHPLDPLFKTRDHAPNAHNLLQWAPFAVAAVNSGPVLVVGGVVEDYLLPIHWSGTLGVPKAEVIDNEAAGQGLVPRRQIHNLDVVTIPNECWEALGYPVDPLDALVKLLQLRFLLLLSVDPALRGVVQGPGRACSPQQGG